MSPTSLDTIVGTNLHMDVLSDLAAAMAGSIGVAPSSNLDPTRRNPSLFEPVHGSAFDIVGNGVANPVATFWSAAEMLVRALKDPKINLFETDSSSKVYCTNSDSSIRNLRAFVGQIFVY